MKERERKRVLMRIDSKGNRRRIEIIKSNHDSTILEILFHGINSINPSQFPLSSLSLYSRILRKRGSVKGEHAHVMTSGNLFLK